MKQSHPKERIDHSMNADFTKCTEKNPLRAIFSDESPRYRSPSEPDPGKLVRLRIRVPKDTADRVVLSVGEEHIGILMTKIPAENTAPSAEYAERFDLYETSIVCPKTETSYRFLIECGETLYRCNRTGVSILADGESSVSDGDFRIFPGFHVPEWAKNAVMYQIFPDRFRNGDESNDVTNNEYYYTVGHAKKVFDWNALPTDTDFRSFYGGDLRGILEKLDYIRSLGVEVIYLNPIFVSPSCHKYDVQDYDHVDPHLGVISDDMEHEMQPWEKHNGFAPKYIRRVTSKKNLSESDNLFATLCSEIHKRGMKIILDGVFNHCGSFNKWMDREGIYLGKPGFEPGAYRNPDSPYRSYFRFNERRDNYAEYEGWWGYNTLPKLNYEGSEALVEEILRIGEKWVSPPYSVDGWRLDVAADLGHSVEYNHEFWKKFRSRVKKANPDAIILSEHYGSPAPWLKGDEWDTVMNYDAFMEPVTFFLTGMEKHSDGMRDDLYQNGEGFFSLILEKMAQLPAPSLLSAMNELSNHDHSRFLTRTNRTVGRITTVGSEAASNGIRKSVFREAVTLQMTWPGSPTIYYADEAGQIGFTDPDCRRTYPWGKEDLALIDLHRALTTIRSSYPVLKEGSLKPLLSAYGQIAYARFSEKSETAAVIALNNTDEQQRVCLPIWETGVPDGKRFTEIFRSDESGIFLPLGVCDHLNHGVTHISPDPIASENGYLSLSLPPRCALIVVSI